MNKLPKPAGCYPPHGTQEAALKAWHIQGNSYWMQQATETSLWTFCLEDRLSLYSSVWSPSWSCPVVSLLAQPFNCCNYRLKWPDLAWEHLCHGPLTRVCLYATHSPELKGSLHVPSHSWMWTCRWHQAGSRGIYEESLHLKDLWDK